MVCHRRHAQDKAVADPSVSFIRYNKYTRACWSMLWPLAAQDLEWREWRVGYISVLYLGPSSTVGEIYITPTPYESPKLVSWEHLPVRRLEGGTQFW